MAKNKLSAAIMGLVGKAGGRPTQVPVQIRTKGEMFQHFGRPEPKWLHYLAYLVRPTPELPDVKRDLSMIRTWDYTIPQWDYDTPRRWRPAVAVPGDPGRMSALEINLANHLAALEGLGQREMLTVRYAFALEDDEGDVLLIRRWGTTVSKDDPKIHDLCMGGRDDTLLSLAPDGEKVGVFSAYHVHQGRDFEYTATPVKLRRLQPYELIEKLVETDLP